jgi:predicted dienelactone hydrolase
LGLAISLVVANLMARVAKGAERISLYIGPIQLDLAVVALETFADTGEITSEFAPYANRLDAETRPQLQQALNLRIEEGPAVVARFAYSAMGEDVLQRLGTVVQTTSGLNGFHAIRAALILAAADETVGLTPLNVLRQFPTSDLRLDGSALLRFVDTLSRQEAYRQRAIASLIEQSTAAALAEPIDPTLPDLRTPGTANVEVRELRISQAPDNSLSPLIVDLYLPESSTAPAARATLPLVVISHPLGSSRRNFAYLGEYLASHRFAVAIPEHAGSNNTRLDEFLTGQHRNLMDATEYIQRSQEISVLLEHLTALPEAPIDLTRVGLFGSSLGGTTVLNLAGAPINIANLQQVCVPERLTVNLSIFLQCRARELPLEARSLGDHRIRAVVAMFPPTSAIFGQAGIGEIAIPTMLISASQDQLAPAVPEQLQPFSWLGVPSKYLVLLDPANHYSLDAVGSEERVPEFLQDDRPDPAIARGYVQALSLAFFQRHLNQDEAFQPYLSAAYAQQMSQEEIQGHLVRSLTLPD